MQRYFAVDKKDNLFILENSDLHHISNVMRMKDGDFVFNPNGYGCVAWENAPAEYWTKNCRIKY